jgi:hypothetical protein
MHVIRPVNCSSHDVKLAVTITVTSPVAVHWKVVAAALGFANLPLAATQE